MPKLFNRKAALTIADPVTGSFSRTRPNALRIEDLRITFRVDKTLGKDPNTCEVSVYNLSGTTIELVTIPKGKLILEAGYEENMLQVFIGDIRYASTKKVGVDWETTFHCGDGERAYQFARSSISKAGKVQLGDLVEQMAIDLGVSKGNAKKIAKNVNALKKQRSNGYTARGNTATQLTKLLAAQGYEWSIQDGELQILKPGEGLPDIALEFTSDTGLIESPQWVVPQNTKKTKKKKRPYVELKTLLAPELKPGSKFRLQSSEIAGNFMVQRIQHQGDTHGPEFVSMIEGVPI